MNRHGSRSTGSPARIPESAVDQLLDVRKATVRQAERVVLTPLGYVPADRDLEYIGSLFDGLPVLAEDRVRATLFGNRSADFKVASTNPSGPVVIKPRTVLEIARSPIQPIQGATRRGREGTADFLRGHRRTQTRAAIAFARSSSYRCAIRNCSSGSGSTHPREFSCTDRLAAARR